ncbi:MAG TPA: M36 family metallopeptidase [Nitriliruptoraceae bacterium]|nr:M36 family metallopeptidase [Nitriliruptoraceae bacterium]
MQTSPIVARTPFVGALVALLLLLGLVVPSQAQPAGEPEPPDTPSAADVVRRDEAAHTAVVFANGEALTSPSSKPAGQVALGYLKAERESFGLTARAAASFKVVSEHALAGGHQVVLEQRVQGLPVDDATITAAVDLDGQLLAIGGRAASLDTSGAARLDAGEAIATAAEAGGVTNAREPRGSATRAAGKHEYPNPYAKGLVQPSPVSAELVWHITDDGSLRKAWRTDVEASGSSWFESVVDAATGEVLAQESNYSHHAEGNVFREQHPGVTGATQQLTDLTGLDGSWVSGTVTAGNNVNAYRDRDDNDANDEYQPNEADTHFNYTFNNTWATTADVTSVTALDDDQDVGVTQMFYYTNDMHDWLYGFGFDEASGNFQDDNFGRGGSDSDPVLAESQDGWDFGCIDDDVMPPVAERCLDNANFGTNADGSTARMQMYMFTSPFRDGAMDGDVIAHEYGHGVSNRLVPGTLSNATNQSGSLGEGWSDTISFLRWGDATVGEYVTGNATGGVRNFDYDTHPWTYGNYSTSVSTPHRNGEIWAATMYDMRETLGLSPTTIRLVLDGMRFTMNGPSPTFLDARDGILIADLVTNLGENLCALLTVFGNQGMGTGAVSNGLHAAQTDDFTIPDTCLPTADANGPYETPEGTDVVLDGSASATGTATSAGALVGYDWDLDNDGTYDDATGVNPTFDAVGQDGVFTVGLQVTDAFGNTDTDATTVTVTNVAPTVTIDPIPPIDEFGTTTVSGIITDPGWLDTLTATIDFDDGNGPQPLSGVLENVRPDATFTFSVDHQYGDDGNFTVTVVGFDDDDQGSDDEVAAVANVDPTVVIDTSGEEVYDGVSAFVLEAGEDVTVPATATDPGSDDLEFTWDWDDGTTTVVTSLVNPPGTDPDPSPSVQPRDVTEDATHTYGDACLYDLTVTVADDDGGSDQDSAVVVVTGNAEVSKGHGWWLNVYRPKPPQPFTDAELACYLAIVNHFSLVFNGLDRPAATVVLNNPAKKQAETQFDQQALAAWLNFANGSISLDTMVDVDGDGVVDKPFGDAMLQAEVTRNVGTQEQIRAQKDVVELLVTQSG